MAYTTITLDQLSNQLGVLLDDPNSLFWTVPEKYLAIQEGLLLWGGLSSFWRFRGSFNLSPSVSGVDLSQVLPTLRSRSWTLGTMVQQIQFALNENAPGGSAGLSGTGVSKKISIQDIL